MGCQELHKFLYVNSLGQGDALLDPFSIQLVLPSSPRSFPREQSRVQQQ